MTSAPTVHQKINQKMSQRIRWLTQWLVLSLAGNAALTGVLVWLSLPSRDATPIDLTPCSTNRQSPSLADHLHALGQSPWEVLCGALQDRTPIEFGFCVRDLALARLVHDYGFDLARALGKVPPQRRPCRLGSEQITLFAGLKDPDFSRLQTLIATERFPLTAAGCVRLLQRSDEWSSQDRADLKATLFASIAWNALEDVFRKGPRRTREQLLQLVMETGWGPIELFWEEQRKNRDVSDERRRRLLLDLFDAPSRLAGRWLLDEDLPWVQKKLSDPQVLQLIAMVLPATPESKAFLRAILMSPRSDAVRRSAGEKLYALYGEPVPEGCTVWSALQRFCPEVALAMQPGLPKARTGSPLCSSTGSVTPGSRSGHPGPGNSLRPLLPTKSAPAAQLAVEIQAGDSLWKLARRYGVDVHQIRQLNHLEGDRLRVGQTLLIPSAAPR